MLKVPVFDSHLHIIDSQYPITPNRGYVPNWFSCADYRRAISPLNIQGGAVVAGSFQGPDTAYLIEALRTLGSGFVGVAELPLHLSRKQIASLNEQGIRAVRFNLFRGKKIPLTEIVAFSQRVFDLVGWHVELYVDVFDMKDHFAKLTQIPVLSIDHLGLTGRGLPTLLTMLESGVYVKATGFSRVDFDVATAIRELCQANPKRLMFGSDLPSTRAPKSFSFDDVELLLENIPGECIGHVFYGNAAKLYRQI